MDERAWRKRQGNRKWRPSEERGEKALSKAHIWSHVGFACPCCELRVKTGGAQEGKKKSSVKLLLAAAGPRATHAVKSRTRLGVKQPRT
jgi:hypothetical protein